MTSTPEQRARDQREVWRVRSLWVATTALVGAALLLTGSFFATEQPPGALVIAITIEPQPTNTPRPTKTPEPTSTATPVPTLTPTPVICGPEAPEGRVCFAPQPTWTPVPTLTPFPIYPGEGLATPGVRYTMPDSN